MWMALSQHTSYRNHAYAHLHGHHALKNHEATATMMVSAHRANLMDALEIPAQVANQKLDQEVVPAATTPTPDALETHLVAMVIHKH